MEPPHDPDSKEDERPFAAVVRDPAGVKYHVDVIPLFSATGPVVLVTKEGVASHGLRGLLNRVVAKTFGWKERHSFVVQVRREEPSGRPLVAESDHGSMHEARQAAQVLAQAIEHGSFAGN